MTQTSLLSLPVPNYKKTRRITGVISFPRDRISTSHCLARKKKMKMRGVCTIPARWGSPIRSCSHAADGSSREEMSPHDKKWEPETAKPPTKAAVNARSDARLSGASPGIISLPVLGASSKPRLYTAVTLQREHCSSVSARPWL